MKHVQVRCDTYNIGFDAIFQVYLHAGGGKWIKSGLENFAQRKMVMDGYHFEKQDPNFGGASGTQILIHKAAQLRDLRLN